MKDSLGDRMKEFYEDRFRYKLARRTYTIIRIDGKAFHTYTKGLERPFDDDLINDMDETTKHLCKSIQGVKFGYVQSDEISLLITDFDTLQTDLWFDGNVQKMCSVAASVATAKFNELRFKRYLQNKIDVEEKTMSDKRYEKEPALAMFDARIFQISNSVEVENYFIWRQQDATRNSISAVAQSLYKGKNDLIGKSSDQKQEMIFQKGINWNDYPSRVKRGGFVCKKEKIVYPLGTPHAALNKRGGGPGQTLNQPTIRNVWETTECPIFTQDKMFLRDKIPTFFNEQ